MFTTVLVDAVKVHNGTHINRYTNMNMISKFIKFSTSNIMFQAF